MFLLLRFLHLKYKKLNSYASGFDPAESHNILEYHKQRFSNFDIRDLHIKAPCDEC